MNQRPGSTDVPRCCFTAERYDHDHAALAVLLGLNGLRVSEACAPTSRTSASSAATELFGSSARGTSPPSSRSCPARPEPSTLQSGNAARDRSCVAVTAAPRPAHRPPLGPLHRQAGQVHPHMLRAAFIWRPSTPESPPRCPDRRPARRPPSTTIYDRRRQNFDRHAAYVSWLSSPAADGSRTSLERHSGASPWPPFSHCDSHGAPTTQTARCVQGFGDAGIPLYEGVAEANDAAPKRVRRFGVVFVGK